MKVSLCRKWRVSLAYTGGSLHTHAPASSPKECRISTIAADVSKCLNVEEEVMLTKDELARVQDGDELVPRALVTIDVEELRLGANHIIVLWRNGLHLLCIERLWQRQRRLFRQVEMFLFDPVEELDALAEHLVSLEVVRKNVGGRLFFSYHWCEGSAIAKKRLAQRCHTYQT